MHRFHPVDQSLVTKYGSYTTYLLCKSRLGLYQVNLRQELVGLQQLRQKRAQPAGELRQDADDLTPLLPLQFADAVVGLHHLRRFNENGLARCRLVVHDPLYLSLVGRVDGDHQPSVAHAGCHIFVHISFRLCLAQDGVEAARDAAGR